ncbi:MAG: methyltransferase domain-containing protein [Clostridia bacterium]|nr:methyltransferase domain-containing protein [Clostridia bacterium]
MDLLCCPVCHAPLKEEERRYCCPAGHSFDKAKQNYVNLLQSQRSSARTHGDDREMVVARRAFLEKGYYSSLRDTLTEKVYFYTEKNAPVLVDAGCGEGWYTEAVAQKLPGCIAVGFDISKDALKWAAKRQGLSHLAVASCFSMPLKDETVDILLNIFSPLAAEEYARVLKKGGHLFRVVPDTYHLWELKRAVYETAIPNRPEPEDLPGLILKEKKPVHYEMTLTAREDIETLFQMTPYYYRTSPADRAKLNKLEILTTRVEFNLLIYEKE